MPELNAPQEQAVVHAEGPLLIFAGAGSGKTRVITYRVANLIATHGVPPYRILAVTFTNKAAGEMRSRLTALAGETIARDLWVGTFHSVCARLLRRYHAEVGLERRFVIYDDSDQRAMLARIIKSRGLDDRTYPPKRLLGRIMVQKRACLRPDDVEPSPYFDAEMVELYRDYEAALKTANAVDFEDLILHIMRVAESKTPAGQELRDRFQYVLVDEFQDTNEVQYRLVRALAAGTQNLCVVGDDDQSIYSWRGANVHNIRGFERDFPDATVIKLEQNYRSSANVVKAALGVIAPSPDRVEKQLWTDAEAGEPVRIHAVRDEREEAAFVVETIQKECAKGTPRSEIAVFYRVNAQSRVLEEALRGEHIPYQIVGGMKFFERAEVKNLLSYLRLAENPRSDADLMRVINVPARGIGDKTLSHLLETALRRGTSAFDAIDATVNDKGLASAAKKRLSAFYALVTDLRDARQRFGPQELGKYILDVTGYRKALRADDTAESDARLENLEEMIGSLAEYETDAVQAGEEPSLEGYLEKVALAADIDGVNEGQTVLMMTVHSAKGLEFDVVCLTGMEEEVFPYRGLDGESPEELEEERRLAYVAITRARKRLTITYGGARLLFGQTRYLAPSRFLADIPAEVSNKTGGGWSTWRKAPLSSTSPARPVSPSWASARSSGRTSYGGSVPVKAQAAPTPEEGSVVDYEAFDDLQGEINVRRGSRVVHKRFGRGIVESVEAGASPRVTARFPGYGSKKVLAEFLSIE